MEQEQFESLAESLEREAVQNPSLYRTKLAAFAALGYGYVAGMLGLLALLLVLMGYGAVAGGGALIVKLGWIVLVFMWGVLRAMWVKLEPPVGRPVTQTEAPTLFAMIDAVRKQARAPRVHEVLITEDFNAAIVQHPRLGIFGWAKNYLILGLPLMQALTVDEFKAVVAHELGHLSGAHGKFGAWIYRLRLGWAQLHHALTAEKHWGSFLFVPFFDWYAPRFSAYSFVQARQQEYEADRMAAAVTQPSTAASALVRVRLQGQYVQEHFWRDVFKRAEHEPAPTAVPFTDMQVPLGASRNAQHDQQVLAAALRQKTGYVDTHPSLADRLSALRCAPTVPEPLRENAAAVVLGELSIALASKFDRAWQERVQGWWRQRFDEVTKGREQLAALNAIVDRPLTVDERWHQARLSEEFADEQLARRQYRALLDAAPDHVGARIANGRILLASDDESGLALLKETAVQHPEAAQAAYELIVDYLYRADRQDEAKPYVEQLRAAARTMELARQERSQVLTTDMLLPHELTEQQLAEFRKQLDFYDDLGRAYLVRKRVKHLPQFPMFVLGVELAGSSLQFGRKERAQDLVSRIAKRIQFPDEMLIIPLSGDNKKFLGKFRKIASAEIFRRE